MYAGSSLLTLDDKGRLALPAHHRAALAAEGVGGRLYATLGPECLEIYPAPLFETLARAIAKIADRARRLTLQRLFVGRAQAVEPDAQGRLLLPVGLRRDAGLADAAAVVLVGQVDHFEVWSEAAWTAWAGAHHDDYASAFAALALVA